MWNNQNGYKKKLEVINQYKGNINIMEVCGTHTSAISRYGLRDIINKNINFISGPGCPVCVTAAEYIDYLCDIALDNNFIITTYGDMIRVPGTIPSKTLENAKALGGDVRMIYSSIDSITIAEENPSKKVVFLAVGFETTCAHTAVAVKEASIKRISNYYVLSLHKKIEPVMRMLLKDKSILIDAFLCPGNVAAIIGEKGFEFLREYDSYGTITGFTFEEIIDGVYSIVTSILNKDKKVQNLYRRLVTKEGNKQAVKILEEVFYLTDSNWRGIGLIKNSGFRLRDEFKSFDLQSFYPIILKNKSLNNGCQCGEVLKGVIKPPKCKLFGKVCTPENPVGPCMVSTEGSCGIYYRYNNF